MAPAPACRYPHALVPGAFMSITLFCPAGWIARPAALAVAILPWRRTEIAAVDVLDVDSAVTLILREPLDASLEVLRGIARYTGFSGQFTQAAKLGVALERGSGA